MKKSLVFLTPATNGKPGEVIELEYNSEPVQFLAPVAYNDSTDLSKLRHAVTEAEAAIRHAKSRGAGAAEIQTLETALTTAKSELAKVHIPMEKDRQRQQIGADTPFSRQSTKDTRQFAEPVPYFTRNKDNAVSDEFKAQVKAAVEALEKAISSEAPQAEIRRLEDNLRVLREQLQNPDQRPRTDDPPRKERIGERPTGAAKNTFAAILASVKAAVEPPTPVATVKKTESGLAKWIREVWDPQHAKRMLEKLRGDAETTATPAPSRHAATVCCKGSYKCPKCQDKAAA